MKKLEKKLAKYLLDSIEKQYHFRPKDEFGIGMIRQFLNTYNQMIYSSLKNKRFSFIERAFNAYFSTTKLPEKDRKNHSAFWFSVFLRKNYRIILLPKIFNNKRK